MTAVRKEEETKEMGKIIGICISEKRGTAKHEVETAKLVDCLLYTSDAADD